MKAITTPKTTTSSQLTTVLSYGAILLLGYFVFLIVEPFLVPLAWSAVLAIFFYPLHEKVLRKMKPSPAAMSAISRRVHNVRVMGFTPLPLVGE